MQNNLFNLENGLSIRELEERQELSILTPIEEVDQKTTTISRCNDNRYSPASTPTTGSTGAGSTGGDSGTFINP